MQIEPIVRTLITQELALFAKFPVIGAVIFSMLVVNFMLTTAQNKTQLTYWGLATVAVVIATLSILGGA